MDENERAPKSIMESGRNIIFKIFHFFIYLVFVPSLDLRI